MTSKLPLPSELQLPFPRAGAQISSFLSSSSSLPPVEMVDLFSRSWVANKQTKTTRKWPVGWFQLRMLGVGTQTYLKHVETTQINNRPGSGVEPIWHQFCWYFWRLNSTVLRTPVCPAGGSTTRVIPVIFGTWLEKTAQFTVISRAGKWFLPISLKKSWTISGAWSMCGRGHHSCSLNPQTTIIYIYKYVYIRYFAP